MNFFGVGPAEAALVFVIALIVIGPQKFPEVMRHAGRWYRVARAYSNEVMKDVRAAVDEIEREVNSETQDLREMRDLTDLKGDLREAREATDAVGRETRDAAAGVGTPPAASTPSTSVRPSTRAGEATGDNGADGGRKDGAA